MQSLKIYSITSESVLLLLLVIFISLMRAADPTRASSSFSSSKLSAENVTQSQSRRAWCDEKKACEGCDEKEKYGPRCSRQREPILGADLCECCFSCVAIRDLGESCGSQLSAWPNVFGSDPGSSSVKILATSRCREGLSCFNFMCFDSSAVSVISVTSSSRTSDPDDTELGVEFRKDDVTSMIFGEDVVIEIDGGIISALPDAELFGKSRSIFSKSKLVNHGDLNLEKSDSSTSTSISGGAPMTESGKKYGKESCYEKNDEDKKMTVSSYPSDDLLGEILTATLNDRRFQIVYNGGDLLSELKVLLNVVLVSQNESMLDETAEELLVRNFLRPEKIPDSKKAHTPSEVRTDSLKSEFRGSRGKRESSIGRGEETPAANIQEILIRSASAHQEYFDQSIQRGPETFDKIQSNIPVETSSQEDESTVRVHITNLPRKMQTLIDLEEKEDEGKNIEDDERRSLQSDKSRGRAKSEGKLPPVPNEENKASEQNGNETSMSFNDRLTLVELRVTLFERVLEEIVRWLNFGAFSMPRDCCLIDQNSDPRYRQSWSSDPNERVAVASGIKRVRVRGNERRLNQKPRVQNPTEIDEIYAARPRQMAGRNFFSTLNGRPSNTAHRSLRNQGKSPCGNGNGPSRREPIRGQSARHRNVQRSIPPSMKSPVSRINETALSEYQQGVNIFLRALQETQIPEPQELGLNHERIGSFSSSEIPSRRMFPIDENSGEEEKGNGQRLLLFPKTLSPGPSELGLQENIPRTKRSVKMLRGILSPYEIHPASFASSTLAGKPSEGETTPNMKLASDKNRSIQGGVMNAENIDKKKTPGSLANRLLFRNSNLPSESTGEKVRIISEHRDDRGMNSTIEIGNEYENDFPEIGDLSEDNFDHIYDSHDEDEDSEYDEFSYDDAEYFDDNSGFEIAKGSEFSDGFGELRTESDKQNSEVARDRIHSMIFPRERNRRASRKGDQCDDGLRGIEKREIPLLLFGSTEKHEPKTIVWPSKWIGYRRDSIQGTRATREHEDTKNHGYSPEGTLPETTTTRTTTESSIVEQRVKNADGTPRISLSTHNDRRARKNRRKLIWQ